MCGCVDLLLWADIVLTCTNVHGPWSWSPDYSFLLPWLFDSMLIPVTDLFRACWWHHAPLAQRWIYHRFLGYIHSCEFTFITNSLMEFNYATAVHVSTLVWNNTGVLDTPTDIFTGRNYDVPSYMYHHLSININIVQHIEPEFVSVYGYLPPLHCRYYNGTLQFTL